MKQNDLKKIKRIINFYATGPYKEISEGTDLINDLGMDSLDLVELIMTCEEEFDIEILDEEVENVRTVKDVIEFIGNKLK